MTTSNLPLGPAVLAEHGYADAPALDVLLVPGGFGTVPALADETLLGFIRERAATTPVVASVCTGSALLARAGVLDGKRATSNKQFFDLARGQSDRVQWIVAARWLDDGNVVTSKAIDRIIDSFPPGEQNQIRAMLSESLKAVITQRLIPGVNNDRMVLALEILIGTLPVSNLIREGKTFQIPSAMQTVKGIGMQVMDDSIFTLLQEGKISAEEASINANNKNRFKESVEKGTQLRVTAKSM